MMAGGGRYGLEAAQLLSEQKYLPNLFKFIATTDRFRSVFGTIPEVNDEGDPPPARAQA
ncbi:hypothetical protein BDZ97DRAFT_1738972 [Flammula alnicola]|nr:hypothetical protein BDZ97DRAFT_1738972 [Flammula alnicola]